MFPETSFLSICVIVLCYIAVITVITAITVITVYSFSQQLRQLQTVSSLLNHLYMIMKNFKGGGYTNLIQTWGG